MLKKFWSHLHLPGTDDEPKESVIDRDKLKLFLKYFPIGRKLLYYPEYHRKIIFHTIIIGYRVNEQFLYANDAVDLDDDEFPTGFRIADGNVLPFEKLKRFQLLVPDTSEMEKQLDYFTRAELGPAGQFKQGNTITLVSEALERRIPTIDTVVSRRQVMPEGPYAESPAIILTPDLGSLVIADRRRHQRVQSALWADLHFAKDMPTFRCVLRDLSETALRLNVADELQLMPELSANDPVIVEFDFGEVANTYRLRGKVLRREDDACVIQIERLYRDGKFEKVKALDIVEIKTQLLNYGA